MTHATQATQVDALKASHYRTLRQTWQTMLDENRLDGVWIDAGAQHTYFADDHGPRFKPNAYFAQWVDPQFIAPDCKLFIGADGSAEMYVPRPEDYWHASAPLPEHLSPWIEIKTFTSVAECDTACARRSNNTAYYGERAKPGDNEQLGNPLADQAQAYLDFHRAVKTSYELERMREASRRGVAGHKAALDAFRQGGTEFDIHLAFLAASAQTDHELPYGNIVAVNEHASILHYQYQARTQNVLPHSLLIDAGAQDAGYASDITRTYAGTGDEHAEFQRLITLMQAHQDKLIQAVDTGRSFADLHTQMHTSLAQVLVDADLVEVSAEEAMTNGLTEAFCPHGLGHLLGLQVHDAGGHLANDRGDTAPPPDNYPTLRFTRNIEMDQVFTIEPGLYFIDSLLAPVLAANKGVNEATVNRLRPYGGVRIEDNVRVLKSGVENLTRDAWAQN